MRLSHLTDDTAYHPGAMARSGAPCSGVNPCPFIDQARIISRTTGSCRGIARANASGLVRPSTSPTSAPLNTMCVASGSGRTISKRSANWAPAQRAWLTAPSCHGTPGAGGSSSMRRWPAHSSVTCVEICDSLRKSLSVQRTERLTSPVISIACRSGSSWGTPKWLRTKCSPAGIVSRPSEESGAAKQPGEISGETCCTRPPCATRERGQ